MRLNKQQYTILLLSAPIGSGHKLAAEALEQELNKCPQVRVVHGNIFDFFPQFLGKTFLRTYLWVLQCCPWLYKLAYTWGNSQGGSLWLRGLLNRFLAYLGKGYLRGVKPDAVIATHATPAGIISCYKKNRPDLWLGAVITDFTIHRWWLCDGVDTYFIADEQLLPKMQVRSEVLPYGIPLRQQFQQLDKEQCRRDLGWNGTQRVCLLMGGGEGLLPMEKIIAAIQGLQHNDLKLVAITGHNKQLAAALRNAYGKTVEVCGFRDDVPQMLAAADMIITKAGGLTSAEILASDLDFIIYKPLPGQEEGNALFLQKHCGAFIAHNLQQLLAYIQAGQTTAQEMRRLHAHPQAAAKICQYVLKRLVKI